jgi:hypothetical protein
MTNNNGVLTVCWYDGRYAANNVEVNYMSAFSFDGGQSIYTVVFLYQAIKPISQQLAIKIMALA